MKHKITETNEASLLKLLEEKREELSASRFGLSGSKAKNVKGIRTVRRHIARTLTKLGDIKKNAQ